MPGILGTYLKQLLFLIVVVAAWALFSPLLSRSGTEVDLDFLDDRMCITISGGEASYTREIGYAEIRSVETAYSLELGEMVTGEQSRKLWCLVEEDRRQYLLMRMELLLPHAQIYIPWVWYFLNFLFGKNMEGGSTVLRMRHMSGRSGFRNSADV